MIDILICSHMQTLAHLIHRASISSPDNGFALAAKEFAPVKDPQDGYSFVYPFGWQEVAVKGQDIVYKDVIEPLESVSVSITQTDKADVTEFGSPAEVRYKISGEYQHPDWSGGQVPQDTKGSCSRARARHELSGY